MRALRWSKPMRQAASVTIDNQAGATIKGGGTTAAAIDASNSFDDLTITNAGTIDGSSSGKALFLQPERQQARSRSPAAQRPSLATWMAALAV